jgi:hypothetical protein
MDNVIGYRYGIICVHLYNNGLMFPYNNSGLVGLYNGNNFHRTILGYSQGSGVTI